MRMLQRIVLITVALSLFNQVSVALSQTLEQRMKRVENKTDYYTKKQIKTVKSWQRPKPGMKSSASRAQDITTGPCDGTDDVDQNIIFSFDAGVKSTGTVFVWVKANVTTSQQANDINILTSSVPYSTKMGSCDGSAQENGDSFPIPGNYTIKGRCSFYAEPNMKIRVEVFTYPGCSIIKSADVEVKTVNIEVIEPQ
jgi:hypothetical protein